MDPRRPTVLQHELIPTTPSAGPSCEHVLPAVKRESLPNASQLKWLGPWDRVRLALRCARRIFDPVYQPPTPLKTEKTLEHVEMRQKFEQVFQEIEQAADAKTALNEEGAATALKEKINDATPPNNKALAASAQALRWIVDATKTPDNDDQASWLETAIKATEKAIRLLGANGDEFRAFVRVEYNRLSRRPDDTERDSSGSTTEEYRGTIDASTSLPSHPLESHLSSLQQRNEAISAALQPQIETFKEDVAGFEGKSYGSLKVNQEVARLIQDTADRLRTMFRCTKCGEPARFRCVKNDSMKDGMFTFGHSVGTHTGTSTIPKLVVVPKPDRASSKKTEEAS